MITGNKDTTTEEDQESMDGLDMPPMDEEGGMDAGGVEPGVADAGGEPQETPDGNNIWDMLMSTEPQMPLEEVESIWDPEAGGITRITRGLQKMTHYDGLPALIEIVIGGLELYNNYQEDREGEDESDENQLSGLDDLEGHV